MSILHSPAIRQQPAWSLDRCGLAGTDKSQYSLSTVNSLGHDSREDHHCCYDIASHCLPPSRIVTSCHADRLSLTDTACVSRDGAAPCIAPRPAPSQPCVMFSVQSSALACFACNPTPGLLSSVSNINCLVCAKFSAPVKFS